jgi:hypothetical protein
MKRSLKTQINKSPPKSIKEEKDKNIMDIDFENFEVPITKTPSTKSISSKKRRRRLILNDSSQSTKPIESPSEAKDNQESYIIDFHPVIYMRKPHTRPTNNPILNSKIMMNPMSKYLIINVDETPISKEKMNAKWK